MEREIIRSAIGLCDTMLKQYSPDELPPVKLFHYHQGVFLSGMMKVYELCGEEKYFDYIKEWVDGLIEEDGLIHDMDKTRLDDIQPGILLFPLYERCKDDKYLSALNQLINILKEWPLNNAGGFWHKECHPNQMWLDSLYMGGPILAEYSQFANKPELLETVINQALIMFEHIYDEKSGLLFHAWDESKEENWADEITGCSSEIWGRALGWYVVALLDILKFVPEDHPKRTKLVEIERTVLKNIMRYRDAETKMWYQVVDKGDMADNWIENSCSCLFTAALATAIRTNVLESEYIDFVKESAKSLVNTLKIDGDDYIVENVCVGTGVCDYKGYISRPTKGNDLHGTGAFLLMCAAVYMILD